ncbi:MAG: transposase [candidate division Zixibacteria bacterium]|nr:transposase [candidate division Zixibacteria bacterium]
MLFSLIVFCFPDLDSIFGGRFDRHILQLFTLGFSTRRVERFFTEFFGRYGLGAQTVSDLLKRVSGELHEYRTASLSDDVRYLYLDGLYLTIRAASKRKYVVLFAIAEDTNGSQSIVGFQVVTSEKNVHWQTFLDSLYRRGLKGKQLQLVVTARLLSLQSNFDRNTCLIFRMDNRFPGVPLVDFVFNF